MKGSMSILVAGLLSVTSAFAEGPKGPTNPFADPAKLFSDVLGSTAPDAAAPVAPPVPKLSSPPMSASPGLPFPGAMTSDDKAFDQLSIYYIVGDEAMLRLPQSGGAAPTRSFLVRQGERVKVVDKWVIPEVGDHSVSLYREQMGVPVKGKPAKTEKGDLLWSSVLDIRDPTAGFGMGAADQMQSVGVTVASPSQRAVSSTGGSAGGSR